MTPDKPNTFIVGAPRCGTTTLWTLLTQHSEISSLDQKEPRFFCNHHEWIQENGITHAGTREEYRQQFPDGPSEVVLDASTNYLWLQGTEKRVHDYAPEAKIIALLRDPVSRAHSHYWMWVRHGRESRTFEEAIREERASDGVGPYLTPGRYGSHLVRWQRYFPKEQLLVIPSQDLFDRPREVLEQIFDFFEVPEVEIDTGMDTPPSTTKIPRNRAGQLLLSSQTIQDLSRLLLPDPVVNWLRDTVAVETYERPNIDDTSREFLVDLYQSELKKLTGCCDIDVTKLQNRDSRSEVP